MSVHICISCFYLLFVIENDYVILLFSMLKINKAYIDYNCNHSHCEFATLLFDCVIARSLVFYNDV